MTSPETAPFDGGLSQDHSSQDYLPPPNNQLQSGALHDGAPVVDYPVKANLTTYQDKSLEEVLSNFVPFNTTVNLTEPWEAEAERDDAFIQAQFAEFAEFLIEMWAWNMARAKHATQAGGERLGERLSVTLAAEKEQGMFGSLVTSKPTRLRRATRVCTAVLAETCIQLQNFVDKMQSAINALCGL